MIWQLKQKQRHSFSYRVCSGTHQLSVANKCDRQQQQTGLTCTPTFDSEHGAGDGVQSLVGHLSGLIQLHALQREETLFAFSFNVTGLKNRGGKDEFTLTCRTSFWTWRPSSFSSFLLAPWELLIMTRARGFTVTS